MPKEEIVRYYLLCSIRLGERKHIINQIPDKKLNLVLTKKEITLFFRKQDGVWVAAEDVIGGAEEPKAERGRVIVI